MKVTVFKYRGIHGMGLIFIDENHPSASENKVKYHSDGRFSFGGTHDLPPSFIDALGGFQNGVVGKEYSGE